ncbi:flagellar hook-length control protein FliK [Candidatus Haliotispira prima]|uniref:Flagellar hook-length control protein FliK n=1 Tax=Candidatus Haliotispira prima TaxID=3034016 RepID=A0ABY8MHE1_9SPIO|nr:flagellar hook-length control protein FliK [Candidatus Haliotispira prima]
MTDPFVFSVQRPDANGYFAKRSPHNLNLAGEESFQDFYRQMAEDQAKNQTGNRAREQGQEPWQYSPAGTPANATGIHTETHTGTHTGNFTGNFAAYISQQSPEPYRVNLRDADFRPGGQPLDRLRQDLEQSSQNMEYRLDRGNQYDVISRENTVERTVPDRRAEMRERQQREIEQQLADRNAETQKQDQERQQIRQQEAERAEKARAEQQAEARHRNKERTPTDAASASKADRGSTLSSGASGAPGADDARTGGKLGLGKVHGSSSADDDKSLTAPVALGINGDETNGGKAKDGTLASAEKGQTVKDGDKDAKIALARSQKLASGMSQGNIRDKAPNSKAANSNEAVEDSKDLVTKGNGPKSEQDGRTDHKVKIQVMDERSAKPAVRTPNQAQNKAQLLDTEGAEAAKSGIKQALAESEIAARNRDHAGANDQSERAAEQLKQSGSGRDSAARNLGLQGIQGAQNALSKKNSKSHNAANEDSRELKPGEVASVGGNLKAKDGGPEPAQLQATRPGRVAELRRQQNQGMQYASGDRQNAASVNGSAESADKQQLKADFEFGRNLNQTMESSGLSDSAGIRTPGAGNMGNNGQGPLLRSFAQQMAQRLQEGPLAQNLSQLRFRLLDRNRGEIRMSLNPENLGQIRIHLNIDGSQLSGHIVADSPEAARILRDNMQHIEASLREGGFDNQELNVSVGGGQAGDAQDKSQEDWNPSGNFDSNRLPVGREEAWEELNPSGPTFQLEQSQINYSA